MWCLISFHLGRVSLFYFTHHLVSLVLKWVASSPKTTPCMYERGSWRRGRGLNWLRESERYVGQCLSSCITVLFLVRSAKEISCSMKWSMKGIDVPGDLSVSLCALKLDHQGGVSAVTQQEALCLLSGFLSETTVIEMQCFFYLLVSWKVSLTKFQLIQNTVFFCGGWGSDVSVVDSLWSALKVSLWIFFYNLAQTIANFCVFLKI